MGGYLEDCLCLYLFRLPIIYFIVSYLFIEQIVLIKCICGVAIYYISHSYSIIIVQFWFQYVCIISPNCAAELAPDLKLMFSHFLTHGFIPPSLKRAAITPVFKSGTKTSPRNYSPTSLTSTIIKIFWADY